MSRRWTAKTASGEEYEYRRVCSVIERRRITSSVWFRLPSTEYELMTPTELRLIADLIESERLANLQPPEPGDFRKCLVCALKKEWGVWDSLTGATVCVECRDKARHPPSPSPSETVPAEAAGEKQREEQEQKR